MTNMNIAIYFIFSSSLLTFLNLYFGKKLNESYYFFIKRKSKVVFLSTEHRSTSLWGAGLFLFAQFIYLLVLWRRGYVREFYFRIGMIITCSGFTIIRKPTNFEIRQISFNNNLNLGYGCALWYYDNYLKKFALPKLLTRIMEFKGRQQVQLPHKLFILCPFSCKIKKYIDDTEYIERCRELSTLENDFSGVCKRVYNITVYQILHPEDSFRCALEYAQPLKSLMHFKELGRMTSEEMFVERDLFCSKLNEFLSENDFHRNCELIQFDDEKTAIYEVLHETDSIKEYLKCAFM